MLPETSNFDQDCSLYLSIFHNNLPASLDGGDEKLRTIGIWS